MYKFVICLLLNCLLLFIFSNESYGQSFSEVRGIIRDSNTKDPIPGVSIKVKGKSVGQSTDVNGNFTIKAIKGDVLIISYIGYMTLEFPIDREKVTISIQEELSQLDEVLVIGYGTAKKKDLTGSVSRLDAETFKSQPMTQLSEMLSGTVAGFNSTQGASAAGGGSLEVRGPTSLSAGTAPMVVLDGVIFNGSLSDINPSDVETIDILKDASSAAVYGARAASGVILVTTKKGKTGKPIISYSTQVGLSNVTKDRRPLNGEQYLQYRADLFKEARISNPSIPEHLYTNPFELPEGVTIDDWKNLVSNPSADPYTEYLHRLRLYPTEEKNALAGKTTDWYSKVIGNGLRQNHDLSIGGRTNDVNYYWSVGYTANKGVIRGDKFGAIRSRLNFDFNVTDWLNVGAYTQLSERDESSVMADLNQMYMVSPFGDEYEENGKLKLRPYDHPGTYHPLMNYYGQDRERTINDFFSSVFANIKLPFGIKYKLSFQPRYNFTNERNFWGEETIIGTQTFPGGRATRMNSKSTEWMLDNLVTWNKSIGNHRFDVTLLYGLEELKGWYEDQSNQNFGPNANLGFHALQFGDNPSLSNNDTKSRGEALMGRINYSLMDRYLFTASLRRDGYSAFGQTNPRAYFPALAFAWKISDEEFMKNQKLFSQLKIRTSWGINGNRDIGAYSALAQMGAVLDYDGSNVIVGVRNTSLANPGLIWEKTTAYNLGLDMGFLKNRLNVTADYYYGYTTDLLMDRQLPKITGFKSITSNLGKLENKGFELTMNSRNIVTKNFQWSSDLVFSLNRNKIVSLFGDKGEYTLLGEKRTNDVPDFTNGWFPGRAIDVVWNYNLTGVWQMNEAEEAAKYNMYPGYYKAEDVNGDMKYVDVMDKKFIGHTKPRYNIGLRNSFSYKRFSSSMYLRAQLGHIIPFTALRAGNSEYDRRNFSDAPGPTPYWTPENGNNEYARLSPVHTAFGGGLKVYKSGSFLRIQDLSLSYDLPISTEGIVSKIRSFRIFGAVRNLYSFDKWPGWDPESLMEPMPRTVSLGINIEM